jgi:hypothetical protein
LQKIQGSPSHQELQENTHFHLSEICKKKDFEKSKYPGASEDKLYESAYRHKHHDSAICATCAKCEGNEDNTCNEALESSCFQLGCNDRRRLVQRSRLSGEEPQIHFGRFASGDRVMKSGYHRDKISKEEKVIAFEMEGAGVWENFPSIIIKSVCDYADSHKDKSWQRYAAAACTKAVLDQWVVADKPQQFEIVSGKHLIAKPKTVLMLFCILEITNNFRRLP